MVDRTGLGGRYNIVLEYQFNTQTVAGSAPDALSASLFSSCAVGELTRDHRRVLVMYELIGLTHKEIAASLAIPVGTSKWRLSNARIRLQQALETHSL